jgi:hypothetical protein
VCWNKGSWQARANLPSINDGLKDTYVVTHTDLAVAVAAREVALFWKVHVRGVADSRSRQLGLLHDR